MGTIVWVEIDAEAPDWNLRQLRACSSGRRLFCAVVKGNAYGHGVREMAELLPSADWFGVNSLDEGLELRALGVERPVLLVGHVPLDRLEEAVAADLRLTVYNRETLRRLRGMDLPRSPVRLHLMVETGTWRQGIQPEEAVGFAREALDIPGVELEGVATHYANIEDTLNHRYASGQLDRFRRASRLLEEAGIHPPIRHTACTAATILFEKTHFDMFRAGVGLYGLWPSRETYLSAISSGRPVPDLRPVLTWKTRIAQLKEVPEGSYVGYGCTYRTTRRTLMAVLPVGYADGYDRSLGNRGWVLVRGRRAHLMGRVCMNLIMVDVTDVPGVRLEDEVVLLGRSGDEEISAETMAGWAGTINYEIVTRISPLLTRTIVRRRS
jgi:alanine racemase